MTVQPDVAAPAGPQAEEVVMSTAKFLIVRPRGPIYLQKKIPWCQGETSANVSAHISFQGETSPFVFLLTFSFLLAICQTPEQLQFLLAICRVLTQTLEQQQQYPESRLARSFCSFRLYVCERFSSVRNGSDENFCGWEGGFHSLLRTSSNSDLVEVLHFLFHIFQYQRRYSRRGG